MEGQVIAIIDDADIVIAPQPREIERARDMDGQIVVKGL